MTFYFSFLVAARKITRLPEKNYFARPPSLYAYGHAIANDMLCFAAVSDVRPEP